jgi:hypothetical protein
MECWTGPVDVLLLDRATGQTPEGSPRFASAVGHDDGGVIRGAPVVAVQEGGEDRRVLGPGDVSPERIGTFDTRNEFRADAMVGVVGRYFFRVIESAHDQWACRRGRCSTDSHATFDEALAHNSALAAAHAPSELFVHPLDGAIPSHLLQGDG